MYDDIQPIAVTSRREWRDWLTPNHAIKTEAFVLLFKQRSTKPGIRYEEAVEEALCFGWIDGYMRRWDDDRTVNRFTPRKPRSNWSDSNRDRIRRLAGQGLMSEAGWAVVPAVRDDLRLS